MARARRAVEDLTFEHYVDRATPNLIQYCLTGKHIGSAVLVMRKAGGKPLEFLKITMEDVLIDTGETGSQHQYARAPGGSQPFIFAGEAGIRRAERVGR